MPFGKENPLTLQEPPLENKFWGSEKELFRWFSQEQNECHCDPNCYDKIKLDKQDINMFSHDNWFKYIIFPEIFMSHTLKKTTVITLFWLCLTVKATNCFESLKKPDCCNQKVCYSLLMHLYFALIIAHLTTTIYSWTIKACDVMYMINQWGSASPSCVFNQSCSGTCPSCQYNCKEIMTHFP